MKLPDDDEERVKEAFEEDAKARRNGRPPPCVYRELDVERMLSTAPAPVPWIIEPVLARGCVTMLAGREGRGKSLLALATAAAIGRGDIELAGMTIEHEGRVLYVDAENGEHEAHRRIHGLDVKAGTLRYLEVEFFALAYHLEEIERFAAEYEPVLIVLDSLRSLSPGLDENDSGEVEQALRPVANLAHRTKVAILILHHASRASGEYRGSTAIGAVVELGFGLSWDDDDPMIDVRRRLSCWKCRQPRTPRCAG